MILDRAGNHIRWQSWSRLLNEHVWWSWAGLDTLIGMCGAVGVQLLQVIWMRV